MGLLSSQFPFLSLEHPACYPPSGWMPLHLCRSYALLIRRSGPPVAGVQTMNRMIEMMRPGRVRTSERTSTEANRKPSRGTRTWQWWVGRTLAGLLLLVMVLAAITLGAGARAKAAL